MIDFSKYFQLHTEMALSNMQKIGKWDDKKNRHGYDKQSVGILSSPAGLKKIEDKFNRVGNYDFNLYFVKKPNIKQHMELGKMELTEIEKLLGVKVGVDFPLPGPDDITVFFTQNSAAERVALTSWTIAHRIGHAFSATFRRGGDRSIDYYHREINQTLKEIFENCYGENPGNSGYGGLLASNKPIVRNFIESIGTMRSARMKKLQRTNEFIYECFAQWLLSDGNLKFNPAPKYVATSNKKAWGNSTGYNLTLQDPLLAEDLLHQLKNNFEQLFDYYCGSHVGTASIM